MQIRKVLLWDIQKNGRHTNAKVTLAIIMMKNMKNTSPFCIMLSKNISIFGNINELLRSLAINLYPEI